MNTYLDYTLQESLIEKQNQDIARARGLVKKLQKNVKKLKFKPIELIIADFSRSLEELEKKQDTRKIKKLSSAIVIRSKKLFKMPKKTVSVSSKVAHGIIKIAYQLALLMAKISASMPNIIQKVRTYNLLATIILVLLCNLTAVADGMFPDAGIIKQQVALHLIDIQTLLGAKFSYWWSLFTDQVSNTVGNKLPPQPSDYNQSLTVPPIDLPSWNDIPIDTSSIGMSAQGDAITIGEPSADAPEPIKINLTPPKFTQDDFSSGNASIFSQLSPLRKFFVGTIAAIITSADIFKTSESIGLLGKILKEIKRSNLTRGLKRKIIKTINEILNNIKLKKPPTQKIDPRDGRDRRKPYDDRTPEEVRKAKIRDLNYPDRRQTQRRLSRPRQGKSPISSTTFRKRDEGRGIKTYSTFINEAQRGDLERIPVCCQLIGNIFRSLKIPNLFLMYVKMETIMRDLIIEGVPTKAIKVKLNGMMKKLIKETLRAIKDVAKRGKPLAKGARGLVKSLAMLVNEFAGLLYKLPVVGPFIHVLVRLIQVSLVYFLIIRPFMVTSPDAKEIIDLAFSGIKTLPGLAVDGVEWFKTYIQQASGLEPSTI